MPALGSHEVRHATEAGLLGRLFETQFFLDCQADVDLLVAYFIGRRKGWDHASFQHARPRKVTKISRSFPHTFFRSCPIFVRVGKLQTTAIPIPIVLMCDDHLIFLCCARISKSPDQTDDHSVLSSYESFSIWRM